MAGTGEGGGTDSPSQCMLQLSATLSSLNHHVLASVC